MTKKSYRVVAPADWRERHLANGWDEKALGPIPAFGIDFPGGRRAEAGQVVDYITPESAAWLLRDGHIEPAKSEGGDS